MLQTIKHQDTGELVLVAKCLTGYVKTTTKISDIDSYVKVNGVFDADYVAYMVSWQTSHGCTPDGIIGPDTWTAIAKAAPTCSTSRNRTSGYTLSIQLLLGGNLVPDAIYGQRTKAAVVAFQSAAGLAADGICGPKTWNGVIVGAQPAPTPGKQPKDYKQGAKPWGPRMYSNHNDHKQTMANSGCGPTAMADIVATLKDATVDPWTLAKLSMEWGDRTYNSGTAWSFFKHVAEKYGFSKFIQSGSYSALTACIDAGGYVVCSMGPGYWTSVGHFICVWKYDGTYTYANDPASSTRKKQKTVDFKRQCKQYFAFYPDETSGGGKDVADGDDAGDPPVSDRLTRGEKICDISKWQPTVNYDAFIADTSLIILRAGIRKSDGKVYIDECFRQHADALTKLGVRFGVYFYSHADTPEKAHEEAARFYEYAAPYRPLFWALDLEEAAITPAAIAAFADELRDYVADEKIGAYVANEKYLKPYRFDSLRGRFDFVWIPKYSAVRPAFPCDLWQYTSTGSVDGISGNVDLNRITGDGHDLDWFKGVKVHE